MKKILLALLLGSSSISFAQQSIQLNAGGCGTITPSEKLQEIYDFVQHNPAAYNKGTAGVDSIPLTVHIVGNDAGAGYFQLNSLFRVICQLNEKFSPVNFFFYIKWPLSYINNTSYYNHDYNAGGQMMNDNNVGGTVNVYFVDDPAGNCGYYTYGEDAVAIKKDCSGDNSTTLTHELGHFFSLPHTFSGWEYGGTPPNPEAIRRSGPGTNCNSSGDGFCDTEADYYASRWSCPLITNKQDQFGDTYHLDSSMYMSYSSDACQSRFSTQQIARMQYNLHSVNNRSAIRNAIPPRLASIDTSRIIYPVDTMYNNLKKIVWNRMPGAQYYYVRLATPAIPTYYRQIIFTADTTADITFNQSPNVQYIVTVIPVNSVNTCMDLIQQHKYIFSGNNGRVGVGSVTGIDKGFSVYPNPLPAGNNLTVSISGLPADKYDVVITNTTGAIVHSIVINTAAGNDTHNISLPQLAAGIYFVRCSNAQISMTQKLVINQ